MSRMHVAYTNEKLACSIAHVAIAGKASDINL
jgi:hypothetical protein